MMHYNMLLMLLIISRVMNIISSIITRKIAIFIDIISADLYS